MVGAAATSAALIEQLMALLPNTGGERSPDVYPFLPFLTVEWLVYQGYGMTEASGAVSMIPVQQKTGTWGSVGQLMPGIRARLLKSDGTYGGPGELGELMVYSPSNALRNVDNEEA